MNTSERPSAPFAVSLIAGVIILLGEITATIGVSSGMLGWGGMMGSMMGGYQGIMGGMGFGSGMFFGMSIIGVVSGLLVLVGAMMLYNRPRDASIWGSVVLVFSVLNLLGMGGFFVGTVLGIMGGLLALTWKPAVLPVQGSVPPAQ